MAGSAPAVPYQRRMGSSLLSVYRKAAHGLAGQIKDGDLHCGIQHAEQRIANQSVVVVSIPIGRESAGLDLQLADSFGHGISRNDLQLVGTYALRGIACCDALAHGAVVTFENSAYQ